MSATSCKQMSVLRCVRRLYNLENTLRGHHLLYIVNEDTKWIADEYKECARILAPHAEDDRGIARVVSGMNRQTERNHVLPKDFLRDLLEMYP